MARINNLINALSTFVKNPRATYQFLQFSSQPHKAFSGSVHPKELEFLKQLVLRSSDISGPIIEIGTLFGFTTQHIACWKPADKQLITVDNFRWNPIGLPAEIHEDLTKRALHYLTETSNTTIYSGSNTEFYDSYSGPTPSMIFIDAGHRYEDAIVDIRWAAENNIPFIAGHDFSDDMPGVQRAVKEVFGSDIELRESVWAHTKQ